MEIAVAFHRSFFPKIRLKFSLNWQVFWLTSLFAAFPSLFKVKKPRRTPSFHQVSRRLFIDILKPSCLYFVAFVVNFTSLQSQWQSLQKVIQRLTAAGTAPVSHRIPFSDDLRNRKLVNQVAAKVENIPEELTRYPLIMSRMMGFKPLKKNSTAITITINPIRRIITLMPVCPSILRMRDEL